MELTIDQQDEDSDNSIKTNALINKSNSGFLNVSGQSPKSNLGGSSILIEGE